uniref:Uncharacterized protein n=1 Tax=Rhabditophanes sp. KR3021 TaxID=114890 RepID=A0AC35U6N8_9BILA
MSLAPKPKRRRQNDYLDDIDEDNGNNNYELDAAESLPNSIRSAGQSSMGLSQFDLESISQTKNPYCQNSLSREASTYIIRECLEIIKINGEGILFVTWK